jgi:hypothetical protein
LPLVARSAIAGALVLGIIGGLVGLVVGLVAYPPTAWFAVLEVGAPSSLLGAIIGTVVGAVALVVRPAGGHSSEPSPDEMIRMITSQLEIYEALVAAQDRRAELLAIVEDAADQDAAIRGLSAGLGVSSIGARAVLDMQLRKLTVEDRSRFKAQRDALASDLERRRADL